MTWTNWIIIHTNLDVHFNKFVTFSGLKFVVFCFVLFLFLKFQFRMKREKKCQTKLILFCVKIFSLFEPFFVCLFVCLTCNHVLTTHIAIHTTPICENVMLAQMLLRGPNTHSTHGENERELKCETLYNSAFVSET